MTELNKTSITLPKKPKKKSIIEIIDIHVYKMLKLYDIQ